MAGAQLASTPFPAVAIDAVILTHAHLDHCGWIPRLVREGFRGPIFATPSTIDLCAIVLPDSGHLQEEDANFYNRHNKSKHHPALPLYNLAEAEASLQYFSPVQFNEARQLSPEVSFRFVPAAHILGSSMVDFTLNLNARPGGCCLPETLAGCGPITTHRQRVRWAPGRRSGRHSGDGNNYGNRQHRRRSPAQG